MDAIRVAFFQECEEGLAELERGLLAIEGGDQDGETLNAVFRAVHAIKGGAGAFGLETLVRFSQAFESTLDEVRTGRLVCDGGVLRALLRAAVVLGDEVRAAHDGLSPSRDRAAAVMAELKTLHGSISPAADEPALREVFGFVEDDCGLEISRVEVAFGAGPDPNRDLEAAQADVQTLLARASAFAAQATVPSPPAATAATAAAAPEVPPAFASISRGSVTLISPSTTPLAEVLAGIGGELVATAVLSRSMQDVASALLQASPPAPKLASELQGLDLLAQRLDGLATFVAALADEVDGSVRVDAAKAARHVPLGDLARRLQLSAGPERRLDSVELF